MLKMFRFNLAVVAAVIATVLAGADAQAGPINGGDQGGSTAVSPSHGGPMTQPFNIATLVTTAPTIVAGDFSGIAAGTHWGGVHINAASAVGEVLHIHSATFGNFDGVVLFDSNGAGTFRNILATGTFAPGSLFSGVSSNSADFSLTIGRSSPTVGAPFSAGWSLSTPSAFVPEPSSFMLAGLGLAGLLAYRRRIA